jgi:hypothetical protein
MSYRSYQVWPIDNPCPFCPGVLILHANAFQKGLNNETSRHVTWQLWVVVQDVETLEELARLSPVNELYMAS